MKISDVKGIALRQAKDRKNAKVASGKWQDEDNQFSVVNYMKDDIPFAALIPNGVIVIDVDDKDNMNALDLYLSRAKINTFSYPTGKGRHYWFRTTDEVEQLIKIKAITNSSAKITGNGIEVDVRLSGRGYVAIDMQWTGNRENRWESLETTDMEMSELPKALYPLVSNKNGTITPPAVAKHGAGNESRLQFFPLLLQQYSRCSAHVEGTWREYLTECMKSLCTEVWESRDYDWDQQVNFFDQENTKPQDPFTEDEETKRTQAEHQREIADEFIKEFSISNTAQGFYWVIDNQLKPLNKQEVNTRVFTKHAGQHTVSWCRNLVEIIMNVIPYKEATMEEVIVFKNGTYWIDNDKFEEGVFETAYNVIPHNYNPNAYSQAVEDILNKIADGETNRRLVMEEAYAACLYPFFGEINPKSFWFVGSGEDGKTTLLNLFKTSLGLQNISSLDLNSVKGAFAYEPLVGKLAMINPDCSTNYIQQPEIFKSITANEVVDVSRKNQTNINVKLNATMIFGINEIPKLSDSGASNGVNRRMKLIQLSRKFRSTDEDNDPRIHAKLRREEASEHMIMLGIKAVQRLLRNNFKLTVAESENRMLDEFKKDNDSAYLYFSEHREVLKAGVKASVLYTLYTTFCQQQRITPLKSRNFSKKRDSLLEQFNISTKTKDGYTIYTAEGETNE